MSEKVNYFVTTVGDEGCRSRCVAHFETLDDAEEILFGNYGDIYEAGYYPFAVIEAFEYGLYPQIRNGRHATKELWYQWNKEKNGYVKTEQPEWAKGIVAWGIG